MNHYTMPTPRAHLVLAAAAMTMVTFGLTVFVPATLASEDAPDCRRAVVAAGDAAAPQILTQDSTAVPATRLQ